MGAQRKGIRIAAAWLAAAVSASGAGPFDEARAHLQQYYENIGQALEASRAGDTAQAGRLRDQAAGYLRQALSQFESGDAGKSRDPSVLSGYGDALQQFEAYDLAAEMYTRASRFNPKSATLWLNLGISLSHLRDEDRPAAVEAFQRSATLADRPEVKAEALTQLGHAYREMGMDAIAGGYYDEAIALNAASAVAHFGRIALMIRAGQVIEADRAIDSLGAMAPETQAALQTFLAEALEQFRRRRLFFADTAEAHLAYAKIVFRSGGSNEALAPLSRSLEIDGSNVVAWNFLGSLARGLGHIERAREAFQRSLEINPDQPRTRGALDALGNPNV